MDLARDLLAALQLNKRLNIMITYERGKFYLRNPRYRRTADVEK